jgi:hypothetical protein
MHRRRRLSRTALFIPEDNDMRTLARFTRTRRIFKLQLGCGWHSVLIPTNRHADLILGEKR